MPRQPPSSMGLGQRLLAAAHEESWVVRIQDVERTLTTQEIVDAYNERLIDPETYVWTDGMRAWEQLQGVDTLVDALHAETAVPPPEPMFDVPPSPAPNEDSAMFSLATLVGDNTPIDIDRADDSGIIDLAALTAAAPVSVEPAHDPLLLPALFPTDVAAPPAPASPSPQPGSSRAVVMSLIAAIALLAAALVFVVVRSGGDEQPSPAAAAPVTSATPVAVVAPPSTTTAPEAHVQPPPEAEPNPAPSASVVATAPRPDTRIATRPRPTATATAPPSKPPSKPPAPTGGCVCKADDLQCQMRCAVKK